MTGARTMSDVRSDSVPAAAWPKGIVVARLPGSLPRGGVVADTPIHAFETPAPQLALGDAPGLQPQRSDIELGGLLAFTVSDVVTAAEADRIVEASERFGYRDEAPGIATPPGMRLNKSVHWMADADFICPLFARIRHCLPPTMGAARLHAGFSERINMYRYDADDVFNRHTDGAWPGYGLRADRRAMQQWPGVESCLTMLLYLNGPDDGVEGGNTRLFRRDGGWADVTPRKGSALFFRHGFGRDSVVHEGCRVGAAVPKYVARINVMYSV